MAIGTPCPLLAIGRTKTENLKRERQEKEGGEEEIEEKGTIKVEEETVRLMTIGTPHPLLVRNFTDPSRRKGEIYRAICLQRVETLETATRVSYI